MSKAIICDICKQAIAEHDNMTLTVAGEELDLCALCYTSPIILSEKRRTRTRKLKAKVGRPKGKKTSVPPPEVLNE